MGTRVNTDTSSNGKTSVIVAGQTNTEQSGNGYSTGTSDGIGTIGSSGGGGGDVGSGGSGGIVSGDGVTGSAGSGNEVIVQQQAASPVAATSSASAQMSHTTASSGQKDKDEKGALAEVITAGKNQPTTKTSQLIPSVTANDVAGGSSSEEEETKAAKPTSNNQIAPAEEKRKKNKTKLSMVPLFDMDKLAEEQKRQKQQDQKATKPKSNETKKQQKQKQTEQPKQAEQPKQTRQPKQAEQPKQTEAKPASIGNFLDKRNNNDTEESLSAEEVKEIATEESSATEEQERWKNYIKAKQAEQEKSLNQKTSNDIAEGIKEAAETEAAQQAEEDTTGSASIGNFFDKQNENDTKEDLPEDSIGRIVDEAEQAYYEAERNSGSKNEPGKNNPAFYSLYRDEHRDPFAQDAAIRAHVMPATDENGNNIIDPVEWEEQLAIEEERFHSQLDARMESGYYRYLSECFPVIYDAQREEEYANTPDLAEFKFRSARARAQTLKLLNTPMDLKIAGDHWEMEYSEETGKPTGWYVNVHAPRVQAAIDRLIYGTSKVPGYYCPEGEALRLIMSAGGIGVDNHEKIFGVDAADFELQEEDILKIVSQIRNSQAVYGHPFGYTGDLIEIHGTKCYPCGYVDTQMLDSLTRDERSVLYGKDKEQIQKDVQKFWVDKTHPLLLQDAIAGHADQRYCVENMVRACMEIDEREDFSDWQLHNSEEDATYLEGALKLYADNLEKYYDGKKNADATDYAYAKAVRDSAEVAKQAREDLLDSNERRASASQFTKALSWATGTARSAATWNPVLMAGGFAENLKGQGNTFISNKMEFGMLGTELGKTLPEASAEEVKEILQQFAPNDFIKAFASTDEAVYAIKAAYVVFETFGTDAVRLFAIEMQEQNVTTITEKEAIAWCEKYTNMKKAEIETGAKEIDRKERFRKLKELDNAARRFSDKILTGGGITDSMQAVRFFNMFLMNMGFKFAADPTQPGIQTTETLEKAIRVEGGTKTILNMMVEPQASSAMLQSLQLTMNGHSPLEEVVKQFLREHQIIDAVFGWSIDFFLRYGLRQVILYFPMSTTINFLLTQGLLRHKGVTIEDSPNGIQSLNSLLGKYEKAFVRGQMGIDQANGLKMCLLTDLVQTGSHLMMAGMIFLLHAIFDALGDDDDDEPDELQKGRPEEWSFGGLFKVVPAWWCYDMIGGAYAIGTAAWVYWSKKGTTQDAYNVLINGLGDSFSGTACVDAVETFADMIEGSIVLYNKSTNPDYKVPEDWTNKWTTNTFQIINRIMTAAINDKPINSRQFVEQSVATFMKKMTPGFLNSLSRDSVIFGNEQRDRSPSLVYSGTDYTKTDYINKEDGQGAEDEIMRRSLAKNNILYAAFLDMLRGINNNQYNQYTGYQFWEQPVATVTDAMGKAWLEEFDVPNQYSAEWQELARQRLGENATDEEINEGVNIIKKEAASQLLSFLDRFNTVSDAVSSGFVMGSNARKNLQLYLEGLIIATKNDYVNTWAGRNDYWGAQFANISKQEQIAIYEDKLNKWVFNSNIPTTAPKYEKLVSDTQTNYVRSDGTVTNALEALFNPDVKEVTRQMGNAPSSLLPWTLIENTDAYNDETKVAWYNDYTHNAGGTTNDNIAIIEDLLARHPEITSGVNEGELILPKMSGSQDPTSTDANAEQRIDWKNGEPFTIDNRRYIYREGSYETVEKTSEEDYKEAAALFGINYDEYKQKENELYNKKTADETKKSSYSKSGNNYSRSSGYSYSRSGGGSSSSYSPKIYSYDSRLYTTKAASMDTKSPYKASSTYLRPGFSTKGSREAYKRSDF